MFLYITDELSNTLRNSFVIGPALDLRVERRFVGIVYAGKPAKFSSAGSSIEALDIAVFADLKRSVDVDLHKPWNDGTNLLTRRAVRGDGRDDD
jgi:hypothetical protein